jgi:hypothetical protein
LNRPIGRLPLFEKPANHLAFENILKEAHHQTAVRIDVIDMKVCAACADEARRLGIAVEVLDGGGRRGNREKSELELRDYRSELLP